MNNLFANVIVDITHEKLDRTFQYIVPPALQDRITEGVRVRIPFGAGNRLIDGYVLSLTDQADVDIDRLKEIKDVPDGLVNVEGKLIQLAAWMKQTYGSTMIQALRTVLPVKVKKQAIKKKTILLAISKEEAEAYLLECNKKHYVAKARLVEQLLLRGKLPCTEAQTGLKVSKAAIESLEKAGVITIQSDHVFRDPLVPEQLPEVVKKGSLQDAQKEVFDGILREWQGLNRPCLIRGITGSGKTFVYLELIEQILEEGKQVIVLIPEISLTWQTVQRFYRRFGNVITVLHSRLSPGERSDQLERVEKGEVKIVIGPRSALFTPFQRLGLIIIDEEHEPSYHSEVTPRYHARETAIERARLEGAHLVMGSATPSVDSYFLGKEGIYALFELNFRYGGASLPKVTAVDMREELRRGNRSIFSESLKEGIQERLNRHEQVMLFLNRRGYVGFLSCRSCGHVIKCPHCDVSLTLHKDRKMRCHYCGYTIQEINQCPKCGSPYIGGMRVGTQQVEQQVQKIFPGVRTLRMDADTTKGKQDYDRILEAFSKGEADILIGTQMIVKGHDFGKVTLVGAIAADVSLYASDYRAAERTYQILVQAAGRAGRAERKGEALIQTYHPEHYSIQAAIEQDYEAFYNEEMEGREALGYPPSACLLAIKGSGKDEELLKNAMEYIKKYLVRVEGDRQYQMIGPAPEVVSKVQDVYRYVIYLKQGKLSDLVRARSLLEKYIEMNKGFDPVHIQFDLNV